MLNKIFIKSKSILKENDVYTSFSTHKFLNDATCFNINLLIMRIILNAECSEVTRKYISRK